MTDYKMTDYNKIELQFAGAALHTIKPLPQKAPFYDATGGPFTYAKITNLLELYDIDGAVGIIPCSAIMKDKILPYILTGEKKTFEEWMNRVYWQCRNDGFAGETAGEVGRLEYVLIDILSKKAGLSFHKFLGSDKDSVKAYGSGGSTHLEENALEDEMIGFMNQGFKTVKIKVATLFGTQLNRDIERIKLVRETVGDDIGIALDANQAFTVEQAIEFSKRIEEFNIEWFEEPIHSYNFIGYKKLINECPIPIAIGESFRNHYLFQPFLDTEIKHFQPVPSSFAGVNEWMKVKEMAHSNQILISSGGVPFLSAPLIATADDDARMEFLEPCNQPLLDYMDIKMERKDGRFFFPNINGLPFQFDMKLLRDKGYILTKEYFNIDSSHKFYF